MCAVELRRAGLHVTGTALWLDARRSAELSFVSHAHADHIARHERVIATSATLRLMAHRLGKLPGALPVPYGRPFELGPLFLELLPAGHIKGSAQIRVTRPDGHRVLYTGDINPGPSLTAEPLQPGECDTLVIESTFGHPRYRFPPRAEVLAQVEGWCRSQLDRGVAPVLLGYPLGKSQEAIKYLLWRGLKVAAHGTIHEMSQLYEELGTQVGAVRRFKGTLEADEVLVYPPRLARSVALSRLRPRALAVLTGWALDDGAARRYGADVAFPLSDHADFQQLVEYATQTGASEVITHHGFARELSRALCERGLQAHALGDAQQMELF
ncbi:MAG TPA: MBL fold metallo-hydrolase [Myxococcales bacterium]|jgi:putative mRNA 3-end processing factor|nr:MBL fold metallo-hydrolase [Myxococcales bacterium]